MLLPLHPLAVRHEVLAVDLDAAVPILPRDLDFVRYLDPCTDRHLDELHPRTSIFNRNADHAATTPERRRTRRNVWLVGPSLFRGNMSSWCGGVSPRSEFNGSVARAGVFCYHAATTLAESRTTEAKVWSIGILGFSLV